MWWIRTGSWRKRIASTIDRYVAENGWDAFRMVEKMVVRSVSGQDNQVIATGGGVVLDWGKRPLSQGVGVGGLAAGRRIDPSWAHDPG